MQSDKEVIKTLTGELEHLIKLMKWERNQATKHREENERLREALREIAASQPSDSEQAFKFKMMARATLEEKK